jgi:hypothetical protein
MPKILRLLLILLLLSIQAAALPALAQAQTNFRLSQMEVDLWPEYDRPDMLVVYRLTLAPEVSLPVNMSVRIPASAGEPNAVAAVQVDGLPVNVVYEKVSSGEWSQIKFTATTPEIQIEYYDPRLVKENDNRRFEYVWPGDYEVQTLSVQVQEPFGATNMVITPNLGNGVKGKDGLNYYTAQVGSLKANQSFNISIRYTKNNDVLSAENLTVQPSVPLDSNTAGRIKITDALPIALGALGILLIVGGGVWYWYSGSRPPRVEQGSRKRRRAATEPAVPSTTESQSEDRSIYCHQCGKRASPGDRFCRSCGVKLRIE